MNRERRRTDSPVLLTECPSSFWECHVHSFMKNRGEREKEFQKWAELTCIHMELPHIARLG